MTLDRPDPEPPSFDRDAFDALARLLGPERLVAVIDSFLGDAPGRMDRVRAGLRSGDLMEVAAGLHSLRSSASMLGARGLERIAAELERHARAGRAAELRARTADLEHAFTGALADLSAHGRSD